MTLLICGAQGQVGQELKLRAPSATALSRAELDITDPVAVEAAVSRLKPTVVINAAAYTAVDKAETDPDAARRINTDGPLHLARACAQSGAALLHISTDYVFDGRQDRPYKVSDAVNPLGAYARTKWLGEEAVRQHCGRHIILRTSWVFGARGNNFARTMLRLAKERTELRVVADQRGGPTPAAAIADALLDLAGRIDAEKSLPWGTYHYGGTPSTTWHGFASSIVDEAYAMGILDRKPVIHPISTAEYPLPAARPANSVFDMQLTQQRLGINPPVWQLGLRDVLKIWSTTT